MTSERGGQALDEEGIGRGDGSGKWTRRCVIDEIGQQAGAE